MCLPGDWAFELLLAVVGAGTAAGATIWAVRLTLRHERAMARDEREAQAAAAAENDSRAAARDVLNDLQTAQRMFGQRLGHLPHIQEHPESSDELVAALDRARDGASRLGHEIRWRIYQAGIAFTVYDAALNRGDDISPGLQAIHAALDDLLPLVEAVWLGQPRPWWIDQTNVDPSFLDPKPPVGWEGPGPVD